MTDPFEHEPRQTRITIDGILAPLARYRRLALGTFFLIFAFVNVIAWVWAANYFKAYMQITVQQDRSDPVIGAGQDSAVGNPRPIATDQVSSEVAVLKGTDMIESAAQTCGLVEPGEPSVWDKWFPQPPARKQAIQLASATAKILRRLSVEADPTSDVIEVSYGHRGLPQTPACVLQQLAHLYIEKHLRLRRPAGSEDLFAAEAERYQKALADSEAKMVEFSRVSGSGDPEAVQTAMAQQLALSEAAMFHARETAQANESRIQDLRSQMRIIPPRSEAGRQETAAYLLTQNLQSSLLNSELKRTQLLVKYDPAYPLVKEVDQEIKQTKQALDEAQGATYVSDSTDRDSTFEYLRQDAAKTQADAALAKASAQALEASIVAIRRRMVQLQEQAVTKLQLEREIKANEAKYLLYSNKREQERMSSELDRQHIADVSIAVPPATPAVPAYSPLLILALGGLFAAVCGFSVAYLAEYLNPYLDPAVDADEEFGVPVMAVFSEGML
jgi:uncharacterized protein involved in exopolysaccharide biosynthesis